MTPPLAYFGGKTTLAPRIAAMLPAHQHYVEPFCGGLSVLLAKSPSVMETVNDLDGRLMTFWRVLRDRPADLERVCSLTPHSRAEFHASQDVDEDPVDNELEVARRVWVRLAQGRGGTQRRTGWRNYVKPRGSSIGMPGYLEAYVDRMAAAAARLARVSLECRPALELIDQYGGVDDGVLLYVDPPYLGATRSSGGGSGYLVDMRSEAEHLELLAALRRCKAVVVLSGYDSALYAEGLAGWDRQTFHATTNGTAATGGQATRTEVLWSNRELAHPTLWDDEVPA
ncbi:DNA adenine methylase [Blastococcus sp. CT_GayMR16]|nr:DNA adenine methylase [Blastococcus sp. CT_GayMR16]